MFEICIAYKVYDWEKKRNYVKGVKNFILHYLCHSHLSLVLWLSTNVLIYYMFGTLPVFKMSVLTIGQNETGPFG